MSPIRAADPGRQGTPDCLRPANVIAKHAKEIGGGKTYAELPQDDPTRETVMNASFLRASLFTSVVALGVAAFVAVMGVVLILLGWSLMRLSRSRVRV